MTILLDRNGRVTGTTDGDDLDGDDLAVRRYVAPCPLCAILVEVLPQANGSLAVQGLHPLRCLVGAGKDDSRWLLVAPLRGPVRGPVRDRAALDCAVGDPYVVPNEKR